MLAHLGTARVSVPKSTLIVQGGVIECFPVGYESDFEYLRSIPGMAYFDRTRYISTLAEPENATTVFFRPRRFGVHRDLVYFTILTNPALEHV